MGQYLLQRRLRHVRSIKINNLCVGQRNPDDLIWLPSYFMVIENTKSQTLYVSEVQRGSMYSVQFNELPPQDSALTEFTLRLMAEVPQWLSPSPGEELWFNFRSYKIDLNQMKHLDPEDIIESYNVPLLELLDGDYVLPNVSILAASKKKITGTHRKATPSVKLKKSFTFNYILKINKILEYTSQVMEETQQISEKVEGQIQDKHKTHRWFVNHLREYNHQLILRIQKKKADMQKFRESVHSNINLKDKSLQQPHLFKEYYGNTYPNLIRNRSVLENLRAKKLAQLVGIFRTTDLFHVRTGFLAMRGPLHLNPPTLVYDKLIVELLNKRKLLEIANTGSDSAKKMIDSCLGYYTLFVNLVATRICSIALPHELIYRGSTSMIDGTVPLYLDKTKDSDILSRAIDSFNADITQIIQFLKHRQKQSIDNQNNL